MVRGTIVTVEPLGDGRVDLARVQVGNVLKGSTPPSSLTVVSARDLPSVPAILEEGSAVVLFLRPAETNSWLRTQIPGERPFSPSPERLGVISSGSADEILEVAAIVDRLVAASREPELDPAKRAAAERTLTFDEIGSRHPRLVEEGAQGLPGVFPGGRAELTDQERITLEGALRRRDLPERVLVALIDAVGAAGARSVAPSLGDLTGAPAGAQEAAWRALARLGAPVSDAQLQRALASPDPSLRMAAARVMLEENRPGAIEAVGRVATSDRDTEVRKAAIAALGATKKPAALPALERCFRDPAVGVRQAAGRAIFEIGGAPASASLARLVFEGPPDAQKQAVALLLALDAPGRAEAMERIKREHPDPTVKHLVEEGFEYHHH